MQFSIIDLTDCFNTIFKLDEVDPFNDNFDKFGYSSLYVVQSFGTLTLTFVVVPVVYVVSWVVYTLLFASKNYKGVWHKKLKKSVFYNETFVFVDESYLLLAISAALNSFYLRWDTAGNIFNSVFSLVVGVVVVVSPLFFFTFYSFFYQKIVTHDKKFLSKFG